MKKFWVVHNIPAPYRLHIFTAMWKACKELGFDFHVHFMSDMSRGYEERPVSWRNPRMEFPYTYWKDYGRGQRHFNPGLLLHIRKEKPEYLLSGSPFDTLTGMLAGRCTPGISSTWCEGNTKTPGRMDGALGAIKRFALRGYDYVAVPGSDAAAYIKLHQDRTKALMPKTILLPNLVDESRFSADLTVKMRDNIRRAIIPARLKPVKGLMEFVSLLTPEMLKGWEINIVGDGELRDDLGRLICDRGLTPFVKITPFVSYEEMPRLYRESDLLILPSIYDPNPLSVVEALHSGLAIALSDRAGNVEEAVTDGVNGWRMPVGDKREFSNILRDVFSSSKERLAKMGEASLAGNSQFWNTKKCIRKFLLGLTSSDNVC